MNAWRRTERLVLAARPEFNFVRISYRFQTVGEVVELCTPDRTGDRRLYYRHLPTNAARAAKLILDTLDREDAKALAETLE